MMKYNPDVHHRRSVRLEGYDYSQEGYYFVTICAQGRRCLFGKIENGSMVLNDAGRMIGHQWNELAGRFTNIELDEYIIMPNHFHGIIIVGATLVVARNKNNQTNKRAGTPFDSLRADRPAPTKRAATVGDIVGAFKSITLHEYSNGVKQNDWEPFDGRLWQRNYYEHIIRDEISLQHLRKYIVNNPPQWQQDELFAESL